MIYYYDISYWYVYMSYVIHMSNVSYVSKRWQCVKTLYPCSSHQNSWDLWMFIPLKMVLIGIDPYPVHYH